MRNFLSMALTLSLVACATAARRPQWTQGQDKAYPENHYMIGVGVGADLDSARGHARAEIARVFRARIEQVHLDVQTESSSVMGKKRPPVQSTQSTEVTTKMTTDMVLEGVHIAETHYDRKKKQHYALAVLDKKKTRQSLSSQMVNAEQAIKNHLQQARESHSPLERAKYHAKALKQSQKREELESYHRIVASGATPQLNGTNTSSMIEAHLQKDLNQILFYVTSTSGHNMNLKKKVRSALTDMGFKVLNSEEPSVPERPVFKVSCDLTLTPFDRGHAQWTFFQWNGQFDIQEAAPGGQILMAGTPTGTDGHLTENTAKQQARTMGEAAVATSVAQAVQDFIFGN